MHGKRQLTCTTMIRRHLSMAITGVQHALQTSFPSLLVDHSGIWRRVSEVYEFGSFYMIEK
jgi:hypothetical protein